MILDKLKNNQHGVTLMELMIYLGISGIVTLSLTMFMVRTTEQRIMTNNQQMAQHNARQIIEKMTYSLRNAYSVNIENGGQRAVIYSYQYTDPNNPDNLISIYELNNGKIYYGQALNVLPNQTAMNPITDDDVDVVQADFNKISSSLKIDLKTTKGTGESEISSTISFRQR